MVNTVNDAEINMKNISYLVLLSLRLARYKHNKGKQQNVTIESVVKASETLFQAKITGKKAYYCKNRCQRAFYHFGAHGSGL